MNADPSGTPNAGAGARRRRAFRCTRNDDPETKRILAHDRVADLVEAREDADARKTEEDEA